MARGERTGAERPGRSCFFFQAEDGIRDLTVTGVQTCALPIYERMVQVTQVLGAGGLLSNPSEADVRSEIGAEIRRYYRGAERDAEAKIRLSKLDRKSVV